MASDSEEDFLSADEGSDNDIPKKYVVAGDTEVCPDHSAVGTLETVALTTAGETEEIDTCTEYVNVKVLLFDEDIREAPASGNVLFPYLAHMKDSQQMAKATPLTNNHIESISSSFDDNKIVNTGKLLTDSSKSELSLPTKSSLTCLAVEKSSKIAHINYSQSHLCMNNAKSETKVIQTTLNESLDTIHNEHIDSKLSSHNLAENTEISKSIVSSINVTCGLEFEESSLHVTESENCSSVNQLFAISKPDLYSAEKLQSNRNISDQHSTAENISDLHSTKNIFHGHSIENMPDPPTENVPDINFLENIHDSLTTVDIPDFKSTPDHSPTKLKKKSKFGLKKPREKLGERMGVKKLGSKVHKPLESISCDSLKSQSTIQDKEDQIIQHFSSEAERKEDAHDDTADKHKMVSSFTQCSSFNPKKVCVVKNLNIFCHLKVNVGR